jgi:hypothetical protein
VSGRRRSTSPRGLTVAIVLACAIAASGDAASAASSGAAGAASSTPVDLGPPNYSAYCQSLGFTMATFTAEPSRQWGCLHSDGSVTALSVQSACEFSYTQRPISAEELSPGVLLTWQCIQASAGSGGPPAAGGGGGAAPTQTQLAGALAAALLPTGRGARIGALLKRGAYTARLAMPLSGRLAISWYYLPKGARISRTVKPVLAAAGTVLLGRSGVATIRIALTTRGRQMLRHARHLRLTARGIFTPDVTPAGGAAALRALRAFTLGR